MASEESNKSDELVADQLSDNLENRADPNELAKKNILRNKQIAHSLQGNAKLLQQQQTKDKLKKGIKERSAANKVYESNIGGGLKAGVANSLQATAKSLEKQQKIDKLKQWQEVEEVDEDKLYESGIKKYRGMADRLHPTAKSLEKEMKSDSLNVGIKKRANESELYDAGIKSNPGMAASLQATAKTLEKEIKTDSLNKGITRRIDENAFYDSGIGGGKAMKSVANSLQATAKSLEKQQKMDKLKQWQEVEEVDEDKLYESGIKKYRGMADKLHPTAKSLEKEMKSDSLNRVMNKRTNESELYDAGIKRHKGMAGSLQANANVLQQQQKRDKLAHKIRERSDSDTFYDSGIAGMKGVANSLQATAKTLEKLKKMDKLKQWQEVEEVDENALYAAGIKRHKGMAGSLQASADALQKEQKKDLLRNQMKTRSDVKELETRGIIQIISKYDDAEIECETQNIISSLSEDELNALKATLQHDIKSQNESVDAQIYVYLNRIIGSSYLNNNQEATSIPESPNTQQAMQDIFEEHELETTAAQLANNLDHRPGLQSLKENNILQSDGDTNGSRLEQKAIRDKIKKGIRNRSESYQLTQSGILQTRVQASANQLEKQRNRDKLRSDLNKRSTAKDLQAKGIMFSSNIASSLQPNAAQLESQLIALRSSHAAQMKRQNKIITELHHVITHKDEEIRDMIDAYNAVRDEEDENYKRCLRILQHIKTEIATFELNCNVAMIDRIGAANIDELVNANSAFNHKLHKYSQMVQSMATCVAKFDDSITAIQKYIKNKYIPRCQNYKTWTVNDIIVWCKSLDHGRYIKHLDALRRGLIQSEIETGELLPDLSVGDLSVTPFNIKAFKDKRDLIAHFKRLQHVTEVQTEEEESEELPDADDVPLLMGHKTEDVVKSYILNQEKEKNEKELERLKEDEKPQEVPQPQREEQAEEEDEYVE